uniref:Uncharacterized protein n=1 Tax=Anguilla anguilla TaxID=7936 RepID=A0A0E9UF59_ANGAN
MQILRSMQEVCEPLVYTDFQ